MDLTRGKRQLDFSYKEFIQGLQSMGFGPTKAHCVQSSLKSGQQLVRGTKDDWKNHIRDVRCYIADRDAQMVINKLSNSSLHFKNNFFKYLADAGELRNMFWANDIFKSNYKLFGDVLAFDATYHTNRYSMIFVPFMGVDCHKKCVMFGAWLIYNETIDSYKRLLKVFIKAHGKQPQLVLTDQDPATKQAVSAVLTNSHHRLCMWHVTDKIPVKLKGEMERNNEIKSRVHKLVWNVFIKLETFEHRWHEMINDYDLSGNKWLTDMYAICQQRVPAYFRELPMCCLMKTTSRCESSNSQFKYDTTTTSPPMLTQLPFELHALQVYIETIFKDVQEKIYKGLYRCSCERVEYVYETKIHFVKHTNKDKRLVGEFKVTNNTEENSFKCSCMLFTRISYLCKHLFCVFKANLIEKIPDRYIHTRWKNDVLSSYLFNIEYRYDVHLDEKSKLRHEFLNLTNLCADRARGDIGVLQDMVSQMTKLKDKIWQGIPNEPSCNKSTIIQDLL
ncbi:protein FAR1-RELATED SEQUENCE 5-like [Bidens hawaiensis]|uniref:protein FAR1-RELATED SEQUENCE 5-like n=1 Tax=Bidens hawaiensis TaxID=980011 RepID=UPI00404ABC11